MKILLVAITAEIYTFQSCGVLPGKSYAAKRGIEVELTEYTINHTYETIF